MPCLHFMTNTHNRKLTTSKQKLFSIVTGFFSHTAVYLAWFLIEWISWLWTLIVTYYICPWTPDICRYGTYYNKLIYMYVLYVGILSYTQSEIFVGLRLFEKRSNLRYWTSVKCIRYINYLQSIRQTITLNLAYDEII